MPTATGRKSLIPTKRFMTATRLFSQQLHRHGLGRVSRGVRVQLEGLLNLLDLLRHGRQHALLQTVEFVETAPRADLAQPDENSTHGLKK